MSLRNINSGLNTLSALEFGSLPLNLSAGKGGETITVTMRGQTPAAHADAILEHYKFTKADEAKFKELYGFDLRQNLTDAYSKKDNRAAHTPFGKGLYKVEIPIPKELLSQIRTVKEANRQPIAQPKNVNQAVAEKNAYDQSSLTRAKVENSFPNNSIPQPVPQPHPTPISTVSDVGNSPDLPESVRLAVKTMESEAGNFSVRFINDAKVRQSYLQQTKQFSEEIANAFRSGEINEKQAAQLAYDSRNQIMEAARLKSSDIGRALAEQQKLKSPAFSALEEKYAQKFFSKAFNELDEAGRNKVWLAIVESSGRTNPGATAFATKLGRLGKGLAVASLAISVYNIATAENKVRATAKEGTTLLGGFAGGAAGGALAGLACGPGAPVCVTVGAFVGGVIGALGTDYAFDSVWEDK